MCISILETIAPWTSLILSDLRTTKSKAFVIYGYNRPIQLFWPVTFGVLPMKPILHLPLRPALCCCLLVVSNPAISMSQSPEDVPVETVEPVSIEDAKAGKYGRQFENRDPEADARAALDKGDTRLLGFATRMTSVPGVAAADRQAAMDACGVHLIKGFGDVIRSKEELLARRQASEYAVRYNTVVLKSCLKKP